MNAPRWSDEDDEHIGPAMVQAAKAVENSSAEKLRREAMLTFARMGSGRPISNIYEYSTGLNPAYVNDPWGMGVRLAVNVPQQVIEAIASKIAKNKPRALILTEKGSFALQRQAKDLNKFLDGLHRETQLYKLGRRVFRDAGTFGTGVFEALEDDKRALVVTERVLPTEILIDEMEAARGDPLHLYKKIPVYKQRLKELFPKKADLIEKAKGETPGTQYDRRTLDMIPLYVGTRLDGKRVYAIEEGTLEQEDWEFGWFAQTFMRWRTPDSGIWGIGVCENLMGIQREISTTLRSVSQAIRKHGKTWMWLPEDAGIKKSHLTNAIGDYIQSEKPPQFITPEPMPEQVYRYLWDMVQQGFKQEGVSEMSASAVKPAGLDSAVALREHHDIESERFVLIGQDWEDVHIEHSEKEIALSKRMYKRGKKVIVRAPGTKFLESIHFEKVDMPENSFDVGVFPVGMLPSTPSGKLQKVTELYEAGFIDREAAFSLLEFPDLEGELSMQMSAIDDVKRILGKIEDGGPGEPPEPLMNLAVALRMANSFFLRCRNEEAPEKVKDLALRFLTEVKELMPAPAQQQAATQQAQPAAPDPAAAGMAGTPPAGVDPTPMPPGMPPGMPSPALPSAVPTGVIA